MTWRHGMESWRHGDLVAAAIGRLRQHLDEVFLVIVDGARGAERLAGAALRRAAGGREDARAERPRDTRDVADAATSAMPRRGRHGNLVMR